MIDWPRVRELHHEIGAEDFDLVADLFLEEVSANIDALAALTGQPGALADAMHTVKGSALNLGFAALADLAYAGERAAKAGDTQAVTPRELRTVFDASVATFQADRAVQLAA